MYESIVVGALALLVTTTFGEIRRCPDGSNPTALSYSQARAYCQDHGGNLATFKTVDEVDELKRWLTSSDDPPSIAKREGKYMLGYAFAKGNDLVTYEGVSAKFDDLKSQFLTSGAAGNVLVLSGEKSGSVVSWTITDIAPSDMDPAMSGIVCRKPKDQGVCSKVNKPYLSSFGGRRIPMRSFSRYWLMTAKEGSISVWTDTAGFDGPTDGSLMNNLSPRPGPFINYVQFSYSFTSITTTTTVTPQGTLIRTLKKTHAKRGYAVFRKSENIWIFRKLVSSNVTDLLIDSSSNLATVPIDQEYSVYADFVYGGGQYGGLGVLIATPDYSFFFDGVDIQVFRKKDNFENTERGLCDTPSKGQSNPFYNRNVDTADQNKTTNIYTFANGQLRTPQFAPLTVGRPLTCTSHALFESAIRECIDLVHPGGKLANALAAATATGPAIGCFLTATDGENTTNTAFSDQTGNTIYKACIESVCAHGPSAKCYYIDKLINKIVRACPTLNGTGPTAIAAQARQSVGCYDSRNITESLAGVTRASGSCTSRQGATFKNGTCYTTDSNPMNMIDAHRVCNKHGSQLPAPTTTAIEDYITSTIYGSSKSGPISSSWLGVMVGYKTDTPHAVPFKKAVATDESTPTYSRSKRLPDSGDNQCVSMSPSGDLGILSCTDGSHSAVCVSSVSDEDCTAECMFPKQCDDSGKTCTDLCLASSFEVNGVCSTNLL